MQRVTTFSRCTLRCKQQAPADYVIASGRLHTLGELLEIAFSAVGIDDPWPYVEQDPALLRKADAPGLCGDASKAHRDLGWSPTTSFEDLVREMVAVDQQRIRTGVEEDSPKLLRCGVASGATCRLGRGSARGTRQAHDERTRVRPYQEACSGRPSS